MVALLQLPSFAKLLITPTIEENAQMRAATVCTAGILSAFLAGGAKVCTTKSIQRASIEAGKGVGKQALRKGAPRAATGTGKRAAHKLTLDASQRSVKQGAREATKDGNRHHWYQLFNPLDFFLGSSSGSDPQESPAGRMSWPRYRSLSPGISPDLITGGGSQPQSDSSFDPNVYPRLYDDTSALELQRQQLQSEQMQHQFQHIEQQRLIQQQIQQQQLWQRQIQQQQYR